MVKAVIYDLDDLMVDSISLHLEAWDILLKDYNKTLEDIPIQPRFVGMRIKDILKEIIKFVKIDADLDTLYQKREDIF